MAVATTRRAPAGASPRVASAAVPLEGLGPGALLGRFPGAPRGFWAREGRWVAHAGGVAELVVPGSTAPPASPFEAVWAQARALLAGAPPGQACEPEGGAEASRARFFGGFSFAEEHPGEGAWEGFPAARFVLPELELRGGEGEGILTLRRLVPPGQDPARHEQELGARLEALRCELARAEGPLGAGAEELGVAPDPAARHFGGGAGDRPRPPGATGGARGFGGASGGWVGLPVVPRVSLGPADPAPWEAAVERILEAVGKGTVAKVVLARAQTVLTAEAMDPAQVALRLWRQNPGSHVFLFEPGPAGALVGAAPETVATVRGGRFRATAVAGSRGVGTTPEERRALGEALLSSAKDLREHRLCVEDMMARLTPLARELSADAQPHLLSLAAIQHLESVVEAELLPGGTVLAALEALHPTPAVCGYPRERALALLEEEEPFLRGWYAGPVGWFDGEGNGVFAPALRSALARGREWLLFAGAGIVEGSHPAREWEETGIKLRPVLRALGMEAP